MVHRSWQSTTIFTSTQDEQAFWEQKILQFCGKEMQLLLDAAAAAASGVAGADGGGDGVASSESVQKGTGVTQQQQQQEHTHTHTHTHTQSRLTPKELARKLCRADWEAGLRYSEACDAAAVAAASKEQKAKEKEKEKDGGHEEEGAQEEEEQRGKGQQAQQQEEEATWSYETPSSELGRIFGFEREKYLRELQQLAELREHYSQSYILVAVEDATTQRLLGSKAFPITDQATLLCLLDFKRSYIPLTMSHPLKDLSIYNFAELVATVTLVDVGEGRVAQIVRDAGFPSTGSNPCESLHTFRFCACRFFLPPFPNRPIGAIPFSLQCERLKAEREAAAAAGEPNPPYKQLNVQVSIFYFTSLKPRYINFLEFWEDGHYLYCYMDACVRRVDYWV
jgi:hypothetical protein